jgi:cytosine/adenosine deaminase-related metal-dependent hydrolase
LPIEDLDTPLAIATDGLSSNWSLNLWDEMRAALMLHHQGPLAKVAERFIRAATLDAARALRSDAGRLEPNAPADIILITLPDPVEDTAQLALQSILHAREASGIYIGGEEMV